MMKDLDEFLFDIDRIENIKQEIKQENFTIEDVKEENNNFQRKQQLNTFEILVKKE